MQRLRGIDIGAVGESAFTTNAAGQAVMIETLPTAEVNFPADQAAVLSWRWDIDSFSTEAGRTASRNVFLAIQEAKRTGIQYLFMDLVSINQQLQGQALIQEVIEFSRLYRELPVIAAYDKPGVTEWLHTMRRPWLFHEARLYRNNPTQVTYVGYLPKQGCSEWGFLHMAERVWESGLTKTILYVLVGTVGMGELSDLRFLAPQYADVIVAAHQQLSRNDYLLTAALLVQQSENDTRLNEDQSIEPVAFGQYQLVLQGQGGYAYSKDILLNGKKVATWKHSMSSTGHSRYRLEVEADAEATIRGTLGMGGRLAEAGKAIFMEIQKDAAKPRLKVVRGG